jgi:flagellar hook-associated protein 1 FlgK
MADLFASLTSAARALQAQQVGLDVVGQNIANVNTAGYARRQLDLASVPPTDRLSAGGGVEIETIRAVRDQFLERRLRLERPAEGRESALADTLGVVEAALGSSGSSIDASLDDFFDAWSDLAQDPTSSTMRQAVIVQASSLATAFNDMAARLQDVRKQADDGVRGAVDDVNQLVGRIAALNDSIARAGGTGPMSASLQDEQGEAIKALAGLVDIDVLQNKTGGMDVSFANGRALVIGVNAYAIDVGATAEGLATLSSGGADVTSEISGGRLSGLLDARDVVVPKYLDQLDTIAYTLAQQVNSLHGAGFDLAGNPGAAVFRPLSLSAGAAAALAVDPALAANPRLVAAAATATAGDNGVARQLAALRDARVFNGTGTFNDAWADLTYSVGQDSASAVAEQRSRAEIVAQIESLRDAVSGVSLDEEAMMMMKFQRAYEANARFFATIDSAISTLMNLVGN